MKRSYLIAAGLAALVAGWIASGQINGAASDDIEALETAALSPGAETETEAAEVPQVRVRTLTSRSHAGELVLFGRTEADRMVDLKAETSARVLTLAVEKGDTVAEGQVLVTLAMDDRKARLAEARARVEQARIAYDAALKLSKKAFRSKVKLAEERAALQTARAALKAIQLDIERTTIRAPFAGVVDDLPLEIGDYVAVGTAVARIVDLDPIVVTVEIAERNVAQVTTGTVAKGTLVSGLPVEGTVRYVSKIGSDATRTFRAEIAVPNSDGAIAEGLTTEVRLPTGAQNAHLVSPSILTLNDAGMVGVKAVDAEDRVVFHEVKLVADTPDGVWLSGLPETVRLIIVGQEFVRAGQTVAPVPEDATS